LLVRAVGLAERQHAGDPRATLFEIAPAPQSVAALVALRETGVMLGVGVHQNVGPPGM
jgi:hypothetical protein